MALNCNFMRLLTRDEPAVFFCTYLRSTDFLLRLFALTKQPHIGKLLWRGQETAPPLCEHTLKELEKMEKIRQYLVANKVIDDDSFIDFNKED